jgi:GTP-binding protein
MSAIVAIVGRPNVGKSTLFNRLVGRRMAIESDIPGTTRDRIYATTMLGEYEVMLVDTGGLEMETGDDIEENIQEQSHVAIDGADVIFFVVDVMNGLTSEDYHAADLLRKSKKPVILVANKCDNPELEDSRYNLFELGFGDPIPVTALHSSGFDELESRASKYLKKLEFETGAKPKTEDGRIKIAFLGRPNVGKSTMINGLFGKRMVVASETPGTTRDATEIPFDYKEHQFTLIDTAGVRRRGKVEKGIEKYSVLRTMQAVNQADICVLLLDATEDIANQDCHVSAYALEDQKGLILAVNKIDEFKGEEREKAENLMIYRLRKKMAYVPWAPVVFTSGLKRKNLFNVLEIAASISKERRKRVDQDDLNVWLDMVLAKHPPKGQKGKRKFAVRAVEQLETMPPYFLFRCEWPDVRHFSYERYLENELRSQFGFGGTSLRLNFKALKRQDHRT